jgi:hypothetical protein
VRSGDLIATLGVLLLVAVLMIARVRRVQRRATAPRKLVEEFLKAHPGPVELRAARATIVAPVVLTSPSTDQVLELLGQKGGEVWVVEQGEGAAFVHVPGWGERR